ncbi:TOG array regulator of axonemal microtubules protein 1-like [Rhinoderma darwinii]|uniref:TOG array regulator of axonemal microtubules protein 1-like n=1 Tax=Rhinoderma darwinii TaxID=43563 RepID=UPI003F662738
MWAEDSSGCSSSVTSSSDSDLSDISPICYGMNQKYSLGDNFADYRDVAAQRVLARLTSNLQLRIPDKNPPSGDFGKKLGWKIPNTPEPPKRPKKATEKEVTKETVPRYKKYIAAAEKTLEELRNMNNGRNSLQAYPSKPLPKITPVSLVQYNNPHLHHRNQHDEPPAPERKKTSVLPSIGPSSSHHAVQSHKATHNKQLKKMSQSKMTVADALILLEDEDWEKKIRGIDTISSLISVHPEAAVLIIQDLRTAVMKEVTNLRSAVSLAAIKCLDMMFTILQANMDCDLQQTVRVLLHKAGESNTFIRQAVDSALTSMVENVSPGRALTALIEGGLCHNNSKVRSTTVKHLVGLLDRMGPDFFLSGRKGITDRAIPAVVQSLQDRCPEARMYGRQILSSLAPHHRLGAMLARYVPPKNLTAIKLLLKRCSN